MKCVNCGKEFMGSKYQERQLKLGKNVFCGKSCGTQFRYKDNFEDISEEDLKNKLEYMFYNTDMSYDDIKKSCGVSNTRFESTIKKYSIKRTQERINELKINKMRNTMLEKYGVDNPMRCEEFRNKISVGNSSKTEEQQNQINNKRAKTKLDKYGCATFNNRNKAYQTNIIKYGVKSPVELDYVKTKRIQGSLDKFGVDNPFKSNAVHDRAKNILQDRYGVKCVLKLPKFKEKAIQTNIKKYGVDNPMKNKIKYNKHKQTLISRYGVTNGFLTDNAINSHKHGTISKINKQFRDLIKSELGIEFGLEKAINNYCYDLYYGNLLIDINPTISHNSTISYPYMLGMSKENNPVSKDYHYKRVLNAINNGYELVSVFDWMDTDIILDIIKGKLKLLNTKIYANKCIVKEISQKDANIFLSKYHLQGAAFSQSVCVGLFYKDELVQVQTFGKPRFNHKSEWEAIRLASKSNTCIVGGVSKGFKYFVDKYKPKSIISYNSLNISTGGTDDKQGFKFIGYTHSQGIWVNTKNNTNPYMVRDMSLRKQGIDRILNKPSSDFPDYDGTYETSNEFLMIKEGYVKVYDCGNATYMWCGE